MYNREWLKTQIQSYLQDSSITAELDTWIDLGAKRVSQVLECWEMEQDLTLGLSGLINNCSLDGGDASGGGDAINGGDAFGNPEQSGQEYITIPSGTKRILSVQYRDDAILYDLRSIGRHDSAGYKAATGRPVVYLIEYRNIYPLPFASGDYVAAVLAEVVIPDGTGEVDALTSYPFIFLNAALSEAYDWKQDPEMMGRYENKWVAEAEQVKAIYNREKSGEVLAMRAV